MPSATKKIREQMMDHFKIEELEPNTVILKESEIPEKIMFVIEGEIHLYRKTEDKIRPDNHFVTKTYPGKRIDAQK